MRNFLKKYWLLIVLMAVAAVSMLLLLDYADLNHDEAAEFYNSKFLTGQVLGEECYNMYQRICYTFQPPLFNLLLWPWLQVSDSVWWFRLFGVLVTLVGAVGIFKSLELLTADRNFSSFATFVFLTLPAVFQQALMCSEYYLMLAFLCWTTCYFIKSLIEPTRRNLSLFILFSVLSVYSQYGAAIQVTILYIALGIILLARKDWKRLRFFLGATVAVLLFAILPLIVFFLRFQLNLMESGGVNHTFTISHGNLLADLWFVFEKTINYLVNGMGVGLWILTAATAVSLVTCLLSKKPENRALVLSVIGTAIVYYLLLAFNRYGVKINDYASMGSDNSGNRYGLFLLPLFFLFVAEGIYLLYNLSIEKSPKGLRRTSNFIWLIGSLFCFGYVSYKSTVSYLKYNKAQMEEIAACYYDEADRTVPICIEGLAETQVVFYLTHDPRYDCGPGIQKDVAYNRDSLNIDFDGVRPQLGRKAFYICTRTNDFSDRTTLDMLNKHGYECDTLKSVPNAAFTMMLLKAEKR